MTIGQPEQHAPRPLWMPHPALLAFIALLWAIAAGVHWFHQLV